MANLTAKQEQFAQLVANGSAYNAAYAMAYDAENMKQETIDRNAHTLAHDNKIATRIKSIQSSIRKTLKIDKIGQTKRLRKLAKMAMKMKSESGVSASIKAEQEINKLHGLITHKSEVTKKQDLREFDDSEIDALIRSAGSREGTPITSPDKPSSVH